MSREESKSSKKSSKKERQLLPWELDEETNPSIAISDETRLGERRYVVVLFADLSGFSGIAEEMDPEELTSMMNGCFEQMINVATKFRGTIDKLMGDCIMVVFGTPIAHEDDAPRALFCALEMRQAVAHYGKRIGKNLQIAIGINAGHVMAAQVGSKIKRDKTVMGSTVNIAQKLQAQAKAGEIRVSEELYQLSVKNFEYRSLTPFEVRGVKQTVSQYLLTGPKQNIGSHATSLVNYPLIGRTRELGQLKSHCDQALAGKTQRLLITGESGLGKTRLLKEITLYAIAKGLKPVRAQARSMATHASYSLAHDLLRQLLEIDTQVDINTLTAIDEMLGSLGLSEDERRFLLSIFPESISSSKWRDLPTTLRQGGILNAYQTFLQKLTQNQPMLICLDSLQWADSLSITLFNHCFAKLSTRSCIILTSRPADATLWREFSELKLTPLNRTDSLTMITKITGEQNLSNAQIESIFHKSGGNPFYLQEITRLLTTGASPELGWSKIALTPGLTSTLQARLDQLKPHSQTVLKIAAAMGDDFDPRILTLVAGKEEATETSILELIEHGVIEPVTEFTQPIYSFCNPMLREAALSRMLKNEQQSINRKIAKAIESFDQSPSAIPLVSFSALANYFERAEDYYKAVDYYTKAADSLAGNGDTATALSLYETALQLLKQRFPDQWELMASLTIKTAQLTALSANFQDALKRIESVLADIARHQGAPATRMNILAYKEIARLERLQGKLAQAEEHLRQIVPNLKDDDTSELAIESLRELGIVLLHRGQYPEALAMQEAALQKAKAQKDPMLIAKCLNEIGVVRLNQRDFGGALNFLLESLKLRQASGSLHSIAIVLINIADAYFELGQHPQAAAHLEQIIEIAKRLGDRHSLAIAQNNLGELHLKQNQLDLAAQLYLAAHQLGQELGSMEISNMTDINLAQVDLLRGNLDLASQRAEAAYENAKRNHDVNSEILALMVLAAVQRQRNLGAQAIEKLMQAQNRAHELGNHKLAYKVQKRLQEYSS